MYILTDEPTQGTLKEAFDALDDAFGTGEFSQGQAITVITNALGTSNPEVVLRHLADGGFVTETEG